MVSSDAENHVLVVDDDTELRQLLQDYLSRNGYRVSTVADGKAMVQLLEREAIQLLILDIMLPGEDGLTLCRDLRASGETMPIIMLSARGDDLDRILGLEIGADDYLAKPFNPRELLARIKGLLRRSRQPEVPLAVERYRFAGWILEVTSRHLIAVDGTVIPLGSGEFRLLRAFVEHPGRVLNRDQLLDYTQGREAMPFDRSIDVQVSRLRRRLHDNPRNATLLKTIRNEGYLLDTSVQREGR